MPGLRRRRWRPRRHRWPLRDYRVAEDQILALEAIALGLLPQRGQHTSHALVQEGQILHNCADRGPARRHRTVLSTGETPNLSFAQLTMAAARLAWASRSGAALCVAAWLLRPTVSIQADATQPDSPCALGCPPADALLPLDEGRAMSGHDGRLRSARWVIERLTREAVTRKDADRKGMQFYEDPRVDRRVRGHLDHYSASGFTRGHLAPAMNHRFTRDGLESTFALSNISPQLSTFNAGAWLQLEIFVNKLPHLYEDVFVMSGPLFLPEPLPENNNQPEGSMPNGPSHELRIRTLGSPPFVIPIPTHFFKVVVARRPRARRPGRDLHHGPPIDHEVAVAAWVLPHAARYPRGAELAHYAVSLDLLEAATGFRVFPAAIDAATRGALDVQAAGVGLHRGPEVARARAAQAGFITDPTQPATPLPVPWLAAPHPEAPTHSAEQRRVVVIDAPVVGPLGSTIHLCSVVECATPPLGRVRAFVRWRLAGEAPYDASWVSDQHSHSSVGEAKAPPATILGDLDQSTLDAMLSGIYRAPASEAARGTLQPRTADDEDHEVLDLDRVEERPRSAEVRADGSVEEDHPRK